MWHDAFICVVSLFHICCMTRQYVYCMHTHDSFIYVAWRIHMCDITFHDSFISRPKVTPSREKRHHTHQWVVFSDITLMKRDLLFSKETYHDAFICVISLCSKWTPPPRGGSLFVYVQSQTQGGRRTHEPTTPNFKNQYSLLHLECRFFNFKSQLMFSFSRSLLPRSVDSRQRRSSSEITIEWMTFQMR